MTIAARPLETVYEDMWNVGRVETWLQDNERLQPRSPASLFDMVADMGLSSTSLILDAGCGQGHHSCALALRFNAQIIALDPLESNLEKARQQIEQQQVTSQVTVRKGTLEALPFEDNVFSLIWCRGVIPHLPAIDLALHECERVLSPGGVIMVQTGFAGPLLAEAEAEALYQRLGFVASSMDREAVEQAIQETGLNIVRSDMLSSEYAEFYEQRESRCAKYMMALAKLLRAEDQVVAEFGREVYETSLGVFHWQVYQMMGKINYHAYLLQKPEAVSSVRET